LFGLLVDQIYTGFAAIFAIAFYTIKSTLFWLLMIVVHFKKQ